MIEILKIEQAKVSKKTSEGLKKNKPKVSKKTNLEGLKQNDSFFLRPYVFFETTSGSCRRSLKKNVRSQKTRRSPKNETEGLKKNEIHNQKVSTKTVEGLKKNEKVSKKTNLKVSKKTRFKSSPFTGRRWCLRSRAWVYIP